MAVQNVSSFIESEKFKGIIYVLKGQVQFQIKDMDHPVSIFILQKYRCVAAVLDAL